MKIKTIIVLTLIIVLCGCNSKEQLPNDNMFKLDFEIPQSVKGGQEFEAKAFITNESKRKWNITHGVDIFTFEIRNKDGQIVENNGMIVVVGLGISTKLLPDKQYSYMDANSKQFRRISISEHGKYYITARANFRIEENETTKEINLRSEPKEIIIE
ncbi:hypothetical protein [Cohnella sp. AR92]|uniref:hypothetical protein n=1 Tax=Cohnella sp. AR92 TaxID=648716 RepID=UPI000F8CBA3B|nr:hypothetical protein [Cohnella sp. AR92]RUS45854.1 hypothetical protein ELR57_18560 [Cohnella sp. AR92]